MPECSDTVRTICVLPFIIPRWTRSLGQVYQKCPVELQLNVPADTRTAGFALPWAPWSSPRGTSPPAAGPPHSFHDIEEEAAFSAISCISKEFCNWALNALLMKLFLMNEAEPQLSQFENIKKAGRTSSLQEADRLSTANGVN